MGPGRRHLTSTRAGMTSHQGGSRSAPARAWGVHATLPTLTAIRGRCCLPDGPLSGRFVGQQRPSAVLPRRSIACTENSLPLGQLRTAVRSRTHAQKNPAGRCRLLDDLSTNTHAVEAIESSVAERVPVVAALPNAVSQVRSPVIARLPTAAAHPRRSDVAAAHPCGRTDKRLVHGGDPRHVDMGEQNPYAALTLLARVVYSTNHDGAAAPHPHPGGSRRVAASVHPGKARRG